MINQLARACGAWVSERVDSLLASGASDDAGDDSFSAECAVLSRLLPFRFSEYPDYTAPWHLVPWPHMRWLQVYYVITIIESLCHAKGAMTGKQIRLEPFQIFIILCFLGPENPDTGLRMIREGLLTIARKSGKTALIAAIVLALMVLDKSVGGLSRQEVYVAASDRAQASITYEIISAYIMQDRTLGISELFRMVPSRKHLTHKTTLTEFTVLSSDAYRAHGLNPAIVVFDETGNIPQYAADEFYSVLTSGYGAQLEPLTLLLSTQAPSDVHVFSQMVDRHKRINQGGEEPGGSAGFVFETPEQIDGEKIGPHEERWWYLGNPGIGVAPMLEDMRVESAKARSMPSLDARFRNLRLNQRSNPYNPLISKTVWLMNGAPVDYARLIGRPCYMALDLSSVSDLTALVCVFEPDEDDRIAVLPYFWLPAKGIEEKEKEDKVPYKMWSAQGYLDLGSYKTIDYELVAGQIQTCMADYDVQAIGYDRWRIKDLQQQLRGLGLGDRLEDKNFFLPIGQGFKDATQCVEALERALLEEKLAHGNHPVLTWCAANCIAVSDPAGNRKFDKAKSYGRIDGIVALAMALHVRNLVAQEGRETSAFESDLCLM